MATVSQAVIDANAEIKRKNLRWAIFKIEGSEIVVESTGERAHGMDEFRAAIDTPHCRYALFDFEKARPDGGILCKQTFVVYAPDTCTSMAEKMGLQEYRSSIKAKVDSAKDFQINDIADLTEDEFASAFGV